VLERDEIMNKFYKVTAQLEQSLGGISYDKLDISDEVKEHVELVLAQFRRANGRVDELAVRLSYLYYNSGSFNKVGS
ncbi:U-box domain-containing protein 13, partial [Glycine soja]